MRLICPNCNAQYEVPDSAIPPEGRDVQCSSCGHTWFQPGYGAEPEDETQETVAEDAAEPAEEDTDSFEASLREALDSEDAQETSAGDAPAAPEPRRELDPAVASVLREEAEHEARRRRRDAAQPLETQPDLGLDDTTEAGAAGAARSRMARLRTARKSPEERDSDLRRAVSARGDLLPDIEEINSSLRAGSERNTPQTAAPSDPEEEEQSRRQGFRVGFLFVALLAAAFATAYIFAPEIVARVPESREIMTRYVALVNDLRGQIDAVMQSALTTVQGWTG